MLDQGSGGGRSEKSVKISCGDQARRQGGTGGIRTAPGVLQGMRFPGGSDLPGLRLLCRVQGIWTTFALPEKEMVIRKEKPVIGYT